MTEVRIRMLTISLQSSIGHQAKRKGHSLETELRQVITDAALATKHAIAQEMRAGLDELRSKYGLMSDSTIGIREDRDRHG